MIPGSTSALLLASAAGGGGAGQYQISRSLRFNSADSAYLSRTPASAGNRKTWTWSGWVKTVRNGSFDHIFLATLGSDAEGLRFDSSDKLQFYLNGSLAANLVTTQVFRDHSSWRHIQVAVDTTQATASDRIKIYVNGSQVTAFSTATYPTQNYDCPGINTAVIHWIGNNLDSFYSSFYLADIHFIDGQALTPSSFGETDATTGQWIPKAYTGTYGTNGFKLNFSNNSAATATTLGADSSGNGNNWTPNNLSVTAGAGNDSLVDTPTSYGTDTGAGSEVRGNYCTWNPLQNTCTLTNGNLDAAYGSGTFAGTRGTFYVSSGKWYWEVTVGTITASVPYRIGIAKPASSVGSGLGGDTNSYNYSNDGQKSFNGTNSAYGATYTGGDIIGVALDLDTGALAYYKNGVSQGTAFTSITGSFAPAVELYTGQTSGPATANFGQRPFAYTAPSGFKALCDTNLPAPTIVKPSTVMDVKLITANNSTQTISGFAFSPDLVWTKSRSNANSHYLYDTVRGVQKPLISNATNAEATIATSLTAFNSDGFTLGTDDGANYQTGTGVAWCWDAGSSTVTNTAGTIQSSVRANASAGFSIVTYTGNGVNNATVGHGLGVAPTFLIGMDRTGGNWQVWGANMNGGSFDCVMNLNTTGALSTGVTTRFRAASSTTFTIGTDLDINANGNTYVAYCFAPVAGYSAFGAVTATGTSDGGFAYTGFRPRFLLYKNASAVGSWGMYDSARDPGNVCDNLLLANLPDTEFTSVEFDFLSNGLKLRYPYTNGNQIVFAAFAEFPFQYARGR